MQWNTNQHAHLFGSIIAGPDPDLMASKAIDPFVDTS